MFMWSKLCFRFSLSVLFLYPPISFCLCLMYFPISLSVSCGFLISISRPQAYQLIPGDIRQQAYTLILTYIHIIHIQAVTRQADVKNRWTQEYTHRHTRICACVPPPPPNWSSRLYYTAAMLLPIESGNGARHRILITGGNWRLVQPGCVGER